MSAIHEGSLRKILILITEDYAAGGLQRSALAIHESLAARGWNPAIFCIRPLVGGLAMKNGSVTPVARSAPSGLLGWIPFLMSLRRRLRLERPSAVIGLGMVPAVLLRLAGSGLPIAAFIGSERAYPPAMPCNRRYAFLRKWVFARLDFIVSQTAEIARWFEEALNVPRSRSVVIPNVVRNPPSGGAPRQWAQSDPQARPLFVAVGRLDLQKGYDLMLRAFALVVKALPEATLVITGDGPLDSELFALRRELGLEQSVEFRDPVPDLSKLWHDAYALLFTSRYEGFPNVLAEAMAHGVPPVAFDCPTGPSELISNGENGFLVPNGDIDAAADRCIELAQNPKLRDQMARRATTVADEYSFDRIADAWAALLHLACA